MPLESDGGKIPGEQISADLRDFGLADFRLLARIGEGGMGVVYRARQLSMERDVALKILPERFAQNAEYVERFYREARLSARLDHPNIVRGLAVGHENGVFYFAMELIDGESLDRVLHREGRLDLRRCIRIAICVAEGLAYAHEKGLIHRDIKPGNVLLTADGTVKLADLGLVRIADDEQTMDPDQAILGTPAYSAPEQMRDPASADVSTDLYSFGATLYHMVTGRKPFVGRSPIEIFGAKERGERQSARSIVPGLPVAVDAVLDRLLSPDRSRRYGSAREVVAVLDHLAEQPNYLPPEPETNEDSVRTVWWRRLRVAAAAALALAALLVLAHQIRTNFFHDRSIGDARMESEASALLEIALIAIAAGDVKSAMDVLQEGLGRFPAAVDLAALITELRKGVVVLLQTDTSADGDSFVPWWSTEAIPMSSTENYRFVIHSIRSCHLAVFQVDARQGVYQLFPNEAYSSVAGPLSSRRTYWLPEPDEMGPRWLYLDGPPGPEWVFFVASSAALPSVQDLQPPSAGQGSVAEAFVAALETWLREGSEGAQPCFTDGFTRTFRISHR